VVTEIVPPRGMNDFAQGYLANVMATTIHAIAIYHGVKVEQVSARKVHNQIAIGGKTKNPTKPQVRNGVLQLLPELKDSKAKEWVKIFEEPDALAIALWRLGYTNK
jgi:hypothetical protein